MFLTKLIKELQNIVEVSEEGDTTDIKAVINGEEHEIIFIDFEEDHYATVDKMSVRFYTR